MQRIGRSSEFQFYLGTHMPNWIWDKESPTRLFVAIQRFKRYSRFKPHRNRWALDSGGFNMITNHGCYQITPKDYCGWVRRLHEGIGGLDWASPQDWMCEPNALKRSGKSVLQHQLLTIESFLDLSSAGLPVRVIPVIQGWTVGDYIRCCELYLAAGVNLVFEPVVGVGSVCRRGSVEQIVQIFDELKLYGLSGLHGYGLKIPAIRQVAEFGMSSDSMAWSREARGLPPSPGCEKKKNCANCYHYAEEWYIEKVVPSIDAGLSRSRQLTIFDEEC